MSTFTNVADPVMHYLMNDIHGDGGRSLKSLSETSKGLRSEFSKHRAKLQTIRNSLNENWLKNDQKTKLGHFVHGRPKTIAQVLANLSGSRDRDKFRKAYLLQLPFAIIANPNPNKIIFVSFRGNCELKSNGYFTIYKEGVTFKIPGITQNDLSQIMNKFYMLTGGIRWNSIFTRKSFVEIFLDGARNEIDANHQRVIKLSSKAHFRVNMDDFMFAPDRNYNAYDEGNKPSNERIIARRKAIH